jgi:hypothetical protein
MQLSNQYCNILRDIKCLLNKNLLAIETVTTDVNAIDAVRANWYIPL